MFDPKVFDELGADGVVDFIKDKIGDQEVVVDGKTVALEDLISAMTARYDSEDNVLRLVAPDHFRHSAYARRRRRIRLVIAVASRNGNDSPGKGCVASPHSLPRILDIK